jgi:peroxiredoxin
MRNTLLIAAAVVSLSLMAFTFTETLPIGSLLPKGDTRLKDISGKEISLKDLKKENGLLVMFSCNTCPYVIKNQERTKAIAAYAQKMNIGVILLNSNEGNRAGGDSYEAMQQYAKEQQYTFHYAVDRDNVLADAFGANRTPECYLFDKELKLVYHGAIDNNPGDGDNVSRKHLQIAVDELAAGKDIAIKETRSVGCGIKRIR